MIIVIYHQAKQIFKFKSLIQPQDILLIKLTEIHNTLIKRKIAKQTKKNKIKRNSRQPHHLY